jgi:hypothetical protein
MVYHTDRKNDVELVSWTEVEHVRIAKLDVPNAMSPTEGFGNRD